MLIKQHNRLFNLKPPKGLKFVYVEGKGVGLFADRKFKKGEDIITFANTLVDRKRASSEAVQVTETKYLDTKWLVPEAFINHGCVPNAKLDFRPNKSRSAYSAIKAIGKDEEITFNYLTTEYDMIKNGGDFECNCESRKCRGRIRGFKYLHRKEKGALRQYLLPYLKNKLR